VVPQLFQSGVQRFATVAGVCASAKRFAPWCEHFAPRSAKHFAPWCDTCAQTTRVALPTRMTAGSQLVQHCAECSPEGFLWCVNAVSHPHTPFEQWGCDMCDSPGGVTHVTPFRMSLANRNQCLTLSHFSPRCNRGIRDPAVGHHLGDHHCIRDTGQAMRRYGALVSTGV
jgi:hypothetical protein